MYPNLPPYVSELPDPNAQELKMHKSESVVSLQYGLKLSMLTSITHKLNMLSSIT